MNRVVLNSIIVVMSCLFGLSPSLAQEQQFQVTFQGFWTSDLPRPGSAHFSPLVGATHNATTKLFEVGQLASPGVENVAELGVTSTLINEINGMINAGNAGQVILRNVNIGPVQAINTTFAATPEHSRLTLLTMIAPSPDWFVGVSDMDLLDENGNWIQEVVLDLNSYDAGTEEGTNFSLSNPATNPREPIAMLDAREPTNPIFGAGSIARITVTRTSTIEETVAPAAATVQFGTLANGGLPELLASDNQDLSARRNSADVQSRVFVEVTGQSPSANPSQLSLSVESSVFARSQVSTTRFLELQQPKLGKCFRRNCGSIHRRHRDG